MLKVYKSCCKNCLLSKDAIVSSKRRKEIIKGCIQKQTYFVCHKASVNDEEIVCHSYYKQLGYTSQMIRIAERLNAIGFVEQPESEKLATYKEMNP